MNPARILIVEDEQITATDLEDTLQSLGHTVVGKAISAGQAVDLAGAADPELVLMDIHLRGASDGIDAAQEIRKRFGVRSIYLTAHADETTVERAVGAEPLGYILKPFDAVELRAAVQVALSIVRADAELRENGEQLATTLESMASGVIRVDGAERVTYLNPSAEARTGWSSREAGGRHITEVLRIRNAAEEEMLSPLLSRALRERAVVEIPHGLVLHARNGASQRICGCLAPVNDPLHDGSGAVIAFSRDSQMLTPTTVGRESGSATDDVIAAAPAMRDVLRFAQRIAESGVTTILLQGESGVGKDVIARFLHQQSPRRDREFIAVNCAAIPDTLLESELFGYERGAFTDARSQKRGVLEMAPGGTVFLDEIGELQPQLQAKLLRVLEDQKFRRLGGLKDIQVDVRLIAASNTDLASAVRAGQFREDLFYRLNVIQIVIPPLRERCEDVLPLAEHFIRIYNKKFHRNVLGVAPTAASRLTSYPWPGNVRELRNTIERAMVLEESQYLHESSLEVGRLNLTHAATLPAAVPGESSLEEVERSMLVQALDKCAGNQSQAARMLGISRDTLRYRVKKFGL